VDHFVPLGEAKAKAEEGLQRCTALLSQLEPSGGAPAGSMAPPALGQQQPDWHGL
jgi:hypothetical protein